MRQLLISALTCVALSHSPAQASEPRPLAELVKAVDIPYQSFTLKNGLRVLVHTDRKAPIVGVTLYYRVGSKNEPRGKTGFAHLYEHLFFSGSENVTSFDKPLEGAGSTATNGSTWYDRTNYVETVPKGALGLALFMESDRMGHLLGALTQDKLDKQRGVVENEKRQGDNEPFGLTKYAITEGLFPVGHPYRHQTIGSNADLDAATLHDVRQWFTDHYAPNNVVLALAGDIDLASAKPLVELYFSHIAMGPVVKPVVAGPVTLAAPVHRDMLDQVATTRLFRVWSGPGMNDKDAPALEIGMEVLGGLASSRLDSALVRGSQLAVSVAGEDEQAELVSQLSLSMDIKPGVDRAKAEAAFDAEIAKFIASGPSADEVRRAATKAVSEQIGALEGVGGFSGKGAQLAEGLLYSGDPAKYKRDLAEIAALTPAKVRAAVQRWLSRPAFSLTVTPGERTEQGEQMGGWGDETRTAPTKAAPIIAEPAAALSKRSAPAISPVGELHFAQREHAKLDNGMVVTLARRTAIPKVLLSLDFDAGFAADPAAAPGTQAMMMRMLSEGAGPRSATAILEEEERLGMSLNASAGLDNSSVTLSALSANLAPSLALMSDVVRRPSFAAADFARVRDQQQNALAETLSSPRGLAMRALAPLLFGKDHPYGRSADGIGTAASLMALTPDNLRTAQNQWLRPDRARITVVGDITMAQLLPQLNRAFGDWQAPASPPVAKPLDGPLPPARPHIVVIDRPQSPQSYIVAGKVLPLSGRDGGHEDLELANEVLGGGFLSRLNLDLREDKAWSYGVHSGVRQPVGRRSLVVVAPVQADRTGASIKAILADMAAFPSAKPVTPEELSRVTDGNIRGLPNRFESNGQVLGALVTNQRLGRAEDYQANLPSLYRGIDAKAIEATAKALLQPDGLSFVVVGDRKVIAPQLQDLGLPVEFQAAE